jgi:outer membrane protein
MGWAVLAALFAAAPAWAELKIGYVDANRLMEESPQMRALQDALKSEFTPRQRDIQNQQQNLKNRADKLQKDAATMSEEQKARAEKELNDQYRELQRKQSEFTEDLNARRNEELQRVQRTLIEEVRAYAKAQNYDLIVENAIYATPALDITPAILASIQSHSPTPAARPSSASPSKPQGH